MAAISVRDLVKHYGDVRAVDGVSFDVDEGEVYALLGHNGAGKSTTVEILEGHRKRTSGEVTVLGHDPGRAGREFRDRIGIVLQSSGVEHELTVAEAVTVYGSCYRRRRPMPDVIELVDLAAAGRSADRRACRAASGAASISPSDRRASGPAVPRRADDRLRPGRSAQRVGARPRAVLRRHDRAADHALPRRGRAPGRSRRRARRGPARRRGHARRSSSAAAARRCRLRAPARRDTWATCRGVLPGWRRAGRRPRRVHDRHADRRRATRSPAGRSPRGSSWPG